jgi:hypothetical protein
MATIAEVVRRNHEGDKIIETFVEIGFMGKGVQSSSPKEDAIRFVITSKLEYSNDHKFHYSIQVSDTIARDKDPHYTPRIFVPWNQWKKALPKR